MLFSCLKKTEWKDTRYDGKADVAPRPRLLALTTPGRLSHRDYRRGDDHFSRSSLSPLPKVVGRIHSRYMREVADLPWMGCVVHLELHVRRFFCAHQECE